jgi:hypothetical protein
MRAKNDPLLHNPTYDVDIGIIGFEQRKSSAVLMSRCEIRKAAHCFARLGETQVNSCDQCDESNEMTDRWYSESVFSVTPLEALVMDACQFAAKGPGL